MLNQITIKNYKAFQGEETLELRPITLLIGKNSSGKSSLCKLFPLLENATSGAIDTNGELSFWPVGVYGESFDLMSDIMKNRR